MDVFSLYEWLVLGLLSVIVFFLWTYIRVAPSVDSLEAMTVRLERVAVRIIEQIIRSDHRP